MPREGKHRVLIVGDSLAATDFGGALRTILDAQPHLSARRRSKSSSGFARPDFFNWMKEAPRLMKRHDPDLVVAIIGGNDGQDLIKPSGQGKRVHWRKDGWEAAYAERVRAFADVLASTPRARVLWLSLPTMDLKSFERKLTIIRRVQQEALADHPEVELVDTSKWFLDDGKIVRQIKLGKKTYALRQEDGVHFSRAGGRWFAERVAPLVLERLPPPEPKVDPADPGPPPRTP